MRGLLAGILVVIGYLSLELWSVLISLDVYNNPDNYFPMQQFISSWAIIVAGFAWGVGVLFLASRIQNVSPSQNGRYA